MFDRNKVVYALQQKRTDLQEYLIEQGKQRATLEEQLESILDVDCTTMSAKLDAVNTEWTGAFPTLDLDEAIRWCMPFEQSWSNHREARQWALEILRNRPVVAVDGSQITPTEDFFPPIGAVQIGWFVNYHTADKEYVKDISFEVLAPNELTDNTSQGSDTPSPERQVNQVRFERECEQLARLMAQYGEHNSISARHPTIGENSDFVSDTNPHIPLCFYDGSFIVSFAGQMSANRAQPYLVAVRRLIDDSERFQVPLVAYVDNPHSRDIVNMIENVLGEPPGEQVLDTHLFDKLLSPDHWGERSPYFICARADALTREDERRGQNRAQFYKRVVFCYIRLSQDRPPARLEMPRWIYDTGQADTVIDLVRAECIVGTGYPYAIETADALAVISQQDRQRFYTTYQQFATQHELPFGWARKMRSKQVRR